VVGVTGTNGKTTVTHLVAHILRHAGTPTEVLGTLTGRFTTPEAPDLQATLAEWRDAGVRAVAMEVSSHALALHRADATAFAVSVFTNLTPEHLDFHGTMEAYFEAKARLFEPGRTQFAVVNADDPYGRLLIERAAVPTVAFRIADAEGLQLGTTTTFTWRGTQLRGAAAGPVQRGEHPGSRARGPRPGGGTGRHRRGADHDARRARPDAGGHRARRTARVFVDYAHTPDGLDVVLRTARELAGAAV
jgi:UDP-N-acetylmuramoyl-L-alanyl-D-glutamate--2,6-diaminopimelate ligase